MTVTWDGLDKKWDPISKITRAKIAGGEAQKVECLMASAKLWVQTPVLGEKNKGKFRHTRTPFEHHVKTEAEADWSSASTSQS
jgi:hypothetical protein